MTDTPLDPLSELAIRHGTDKFGYHDYTPNYHKLFARFRDRPVKVLEIGVGGYQDEDRGGQSLAMWRDYFPQGQITGIDIQKKTMDLGPRVQILQGSQVDPEFLAHLVATRGPFDIIIDDGSHRNEHVVESFGLLWPDLVPGGIYAVEDVQTAFMPRFGGSLTLDPPNSVGMAAALALSFDPADPLTGDVVALERFHNIVAMHKAGPGAPTGAVEAAEALAGHDIALIDGSGDWRAAFAALAMPGALVIAATPARETTLGADLFDRFVQVDHREIAVHFPKAPIDEVAREIHAMERHRDGWLLVKRPNDYPSNFAYDPDQPQAAAAIAAIERVLQDCDEENGLVQFANMLTNIRGREAARPWLDRLEANGATARVFFQLAAGLAQRERRLPAATALFRRALEVYPDDAGFALGLGSVLLPQGEVAEAEAAVASALAARPRDSNLWILRARIAERQGTPAVAQEHARKAIEVAPPPRKPAGALLLAELQLRAGDDAAAEATLTEITAGDSRFAAKAWRLMSGLLAGRGDDAGARDAADRAVDLAPEAAEYRKWQGRLTAAAAE